MTTYNGRMKKKSVIRSKKKIIQTVELIRLPDKTAFAYRRSHSTIQFSLERFGTRR